MVEVKSSRISKVKVERKTAPPGARKIESLALDNACGYLAANKVINVALYHIEETEHGYECRLHTGESFVVFIPRSMAIVKYKFE